MGTYFKGDMELQRSLQSLFLKSNQNKFDELVKALEEGDIKLAYRLAHSLKGNAGQLGKIILQQAAAAVEIRLKDGENLVTESHLKDLETGLKAVLTEFAELLDEVDDSKVTVQSEGTRERLDEESTRELIRELEPLLEMGNPETRGFIGSLRCIQDSEELIQQIEDFNFEQAIFALAELKKKLGMA